jgi:predicted esterase
MRMNVGALLKALTVGVGVGIVVRALRRPSKLSVDCSELGTKGGILDGIRYLETVRGSSDSSQPMPMVVVFHSRGATPEGAATFASVPGPVRIIRPAGFIPTAGGGYTWFSKSSSTNPEQLADEERQRAGQLQAWLAKLMHCRPTTGLPVVTGSSEGGHVAYLLASQSPGLIGGAVALLGYIPPALWSRAMAPTVGLHTTGDTTIPYARTKAFWDAMKSAGAVLRTDTFAGGHAVSSEMSSAWVREVKSFVEAQRSA